MKIEELFEEIWQWQKETFDTTPKGACVGLKNEATELYESFLLTNHLLAKDKQLEEIADCFHYIVYIGRKKGFTMNEMMIALFQKLEKNKLREWNKKTDGSGCYQHKIKT